jgi:hypothetical protein
MSALNLLKSNIPHALTGTGILRPSHRSFQRSGWLPKSQDAYDRYMKKLHSKVHSDIYMNVDALLPAVKEFKDFVESDPTVYGEFIRMFDSVTEAVCDVSHISLEVMAGANVSIPAQEP